MVCGRDASHQKKSRSGTFIVCCIYTLYNSLAELRSTMEGCLAPGVTRVRLTLVSVDSISRSLARTSSMSICSLETSRYPLEFSLQHCMPHHVASACLSVRVQNREARATLTFSNNSSLGAHTSRQFRHPSSGGVRSWCVLGPAQCAMCRCSLLSEAPMRICLTFGPMCL